MASELEAVVREMFARLDEKDFEAGLRTVAADVQAVDEVSRRWMRSQAELRAYMDRLRDAVQDITSEISGVHETMLGEVGLVTCWLEQDYTLAGERRHISAPTSVMLRRQDGEWRISMIHSVPLLP